jgi:outer membrane protein assembly factor BamB
VWYRRLGPPVRRWAVVLLGALVAVVAVSVLPAARGGVGPPATATAYHVNPAPTGFSAAQITPPLHRRWVRDIDGAFSYPLIADAKVFVSVITDNEDWLVQALSARNSATLWSRPFPGYVLVGTALEGETLFVLTSNGTLTALRTDTGHVRWSRELSRPGAYSFSSPPTASRGQVFVSAGGQGGHVFGVNSRTGVVEWHSVVNGSGSSPAVGGESVFVAFPAPQVYALARTGGGVDWHVGAFPHGGGGFVPTYYRGRVYAYEKTGLVLDAQNGRLVDSYWSAASPAVHEDTLLLLESGLLHAVDRADHAHRWLFRSRDGSRLVTSPLIVNGYGYAASEGGTLYALGLGVGRLLWQARLGSRVQPARHSFSGGAMPGMAAGGGLLVVPAIDRLVAYED